VRTPGILGIKAAILSASLSILPVSGAQVTYKDFQAGSTAIGAQKIPFRLFVPKGYDPAKKYPLMITLHGAGERGLDDSVHLTHYISRIWADSAAQAIAPTFVLAPQCPREPLQWVSTPWANGTYNSDQQALSVPMQGVLKILDSLETVYSLDLSRIYASGLSMGGYGAWYLLMKYPNRFAAAVPVCGAADTAKASSIAGIPVWAFHAADDNVVPVKGSREMINALRAAGGSPKYTEYPASQRYGHDSWTPAAATPGLVQWVFAQSRTVVSIRPLEGREAAGRSGVPSVLGFRFLEGSRSLDLLGRTWESTRPIVP